MTVDTDRLRAAELAARTPATRNRYVDLLRVASLGVVVVGHWLMAGIWIEDGEINGRNVLELMPDERARAGLFLAFQYPVAIPGVSMANFLRTAVNAIKEQGNGGGKNKDRDNDK